MIVVLRAMATPKIAREAPNQTGNLIPRDCRRPCDTQRKSIPKLRCRTLDGRSGLTGGCGFCTVTTRQFFAVVVQSVPFRRGLNAQRCVLGIAFKLARVYFTQAR